MLRTVIGVCMIGALIAAIWVMARDLAPPNALVFAAGSEGGGYWRIAERYKAVLARDDIDVTIVETKGSVENAALLASGEADVALIQGGIEVRGTAEALGAIMLEPLFLFTRTDAQVPPNVGSWDGVRLAAGDHGSGTRAAVARLLAAARVSPEQLVLDKAGGEAAATALLEGRVDLAVLVAPIDAQYLAPLIDSDDIAFFSPAHVDAVSRSLPQSQVISLPSGGLRLYPPRPAEGLPLLAMVATLAAQPDLHPALVDRLVAAARRIHGGRSPINAAGTFPTMEGTVLPPNAQARDLLASGPSPLARYLPYWIVAQINRIALLLVPVLILMLPILQVLPGVYAFGMRRRVFRYYAAFNEIEVASANADRKELTLLDRRLNELDTEIAGLNLPLPYREFAYTARLHIDLLRTKIAERAKILGA